MLLTSENIEDFFKALQARVWESSKDIDSPGYQCVRFGLRLMVFSFLTKNVHFIPKNSISCLFLKNVAPSKRVVCFILTNLHFPMVEGIAFYASHKSRVLIIPYKADVFCLFIRLPDEI